MFDCLIYDMVEQMALFVIENNGKTVLIDTGTSCEVDSLLNIIKVIDTDFLKIIYFSLDDCLWQTELRDTVG